MYGVSRRDRPGARGWRPAMSFDPRRVLLGLAMAGSLILAPPTVGYAVLGVRSSEHGVVTDVMKNPANDTGAAAFDNDTGAPPPPPLPPPPPPPPSLLPPPPPPPPG